MPPDFQQRTIEILGRRAALRCSNPDCDKLTTGPNTHETRATNIGEAAHIFGARPGAARYRTEMTDDERASITNGIWLCSDCHGLIDKDAGRYPDNLLLLWKEKHEEKISNELGRPGDRLRRLAAERELGQFGVLPPYAAELIRERPNYWEHILTSELLDYYTKPVLRRARDLERGLLTRPRKLLAYDDFLVWLGEKPEELQRVTEVIGSILVELQASWGLPGEPGDPEMIDHACQLFAKAAEHFVAIADDSRFTKAPPGFEDITECLVDGALYALQRIPELSAFFRTVLSEETPKGTHSFSLVIGLPDGWADRFSAALHRGHLGG